MLEDARPTREVLVIERDSGTGRDVGAAVDLDKAFPPHDPGPWPAGMSLRREGMYDERGR